MTPEQELEQLLAAERSVQPEPLAQTTGWQRLDAALSAGVPPLDVPVDGIAALWSPPTITGKLLAMASAAKHALAPLGLALASAPPALQLVVWFAGGALATSAVVVSTQAWLGPSPPAAASTAHQPALSSARRLNQGVPVRMPARERATPAPPPTPALPSAAASSPAPAFEQRQVLPAQSRAAASAQAPSAEQGSDASSAATPDSQTLKAGTGVAFEQELALIRKAKLEFDAGRLAAARAALAQHSVRFPKGVFAAERDGLSVLIACQRGSGDAERAARAFLASYPGSPMAERIHQACGL